MLSEKSQSWSLHTVWFRLYSINKVTPLQRWSMNQWYPGVRAGEWVWLQREAPGSSVAMGPSAPELQRRILPPTHAMKLPKPHTRAGEWNRWHPSKAGGPYQGYRSGFACWILHRSHAMCTSGELCAGTCGQAFCNFLWIYDYFKVKSQTQFFRWGQNISLVKNC